MSLEDDINFMVMSIEQLSAENAMLKSILLTNSSNPRGFEDYYEIGDMPTRFGFMGGSLDELGRTLQGRYLRNKFDFLG